MGRGRRFGIAGSLTVVLGAVLYGCALFVPAVWAAAGITVEIIKPTTESRCTFNTGQEYEFEAVAFVEGQELPGGEVSWEWDFGDGTDHVLVNPTTHTFAYSGNWTVTVTATYGQLSGQDTLNAAAAAGGLLDAVEFLVVPDTGGQVCDQVEVMWRVPWDEINDDITNAQPVRIYRNNDGQWEEQYTYGRLQQMEDDEWYYVVSTWWDSCSDPNTAAVDWRVDYTLRVIEPPPPGEEAPYYATVTDTKTRSWTPFNTVLTGDEECLIKHCVGETKHTVSFSTTHLQDTAKGIDPKYQVVLTIYDLAGNQVDQVTKDNVPLGSGSIDWEPQFGAGGEPPEQPADHDQIYAYHLSADHGMCGDEWPKPSPGSVVSAETSEILGGNSFKIRVKYHLSRAARKAAIRAWRKKQEGWQQAGETEISGDGLTAGDHEAHLVIADGAGDYTITFVAWQTPEDGEENRDGQSDPGGAGGVVLPVVVASVALRGTGQGADDWFIQEINWVHDLQIRVGRDETGDYVAPAYQCTLMNMPDAPATAHQFYQRLGSLDASDLPSPDVTSRDSLIDYVGHGMPGALLLSGSAEHTRLLVGTGVNTPPDGNGGGDYYYLGNLPAGCLNRCECVILSACFSGVVPEGGGKSCIEAFQDLGAACVIGTTKAAHCLPSVTFQRWFWMDTMGNGMHVSEAFLHAKGKSGDPLLWTKVGGTEHDLRPARYR